MGCSLFSSLTRTLFCLKRCYIFMLVKFVLTGNIKFSDGQAVRRLRVILLVTGASGSSVFSGAMSGGGALSFSTLLEKFLSASDGPRDWLTPTHPLFFCSKTGVNKYESSQPECAMDRPDNKPQGGLNLCPPKSQYRNPFNQQIKICRFHICTCWVEFSWVEFH